MAEGFDNILIELSMNAKGYDDIPIVCEWNHQIWEQCCVEVSLVAPGSYNFENMSLEFSIISGGVVETIPVIFSIIRAPQTFSSYVMQKMYCVTTELCDNSDQELSDWNVSPNQTWYLAINGSSAYLYDNQADMLADTNRIAIATIGSDLIGVFVYDDEYDTEIVPFYYQDVPYHFTVSETVAAFRYYSIKPYTDLDEIRHPIYNNSNIVMSRGEAELNLHTYTVLNRELVLGTHIPTMEVGEVVTFESVRRNMEEMSQILSMSINGELNKDGTASLTNTIQVANYRELLRQ